VHRERAYCDAVELKATQIDRLAAEAKRLLTSHDGRSWRSLVGKRGSSVLSTALIEQLQVDDAGWIDAERGRSSAEGGQARDPALVLLRASDCGDTKPTANADQLDE